MALTLLTRNKKAIFERCRGDYSTEMRLKYAPYYHTAESQKGTHITLQGRDVIMLSSNDYLGLSFHPKVIEAGRAAMLRWGTSTTGARPSNGSRAFHHEIEEKLATADNIGTANGALTALGDVKTAISQLAKDRALIGANIETLTAYGNQLSTLNNNLSAANSQITDVDVAQESTNYAKYNILVQTGTAMLAQANALPQSVLKLLG